MKKEYKIDINDFTGFKLNIVREVNKNLPTPIKPYLDNKINKKYPGLPQNIKDQLYVIIAEDILKVI